MQEAILLAVVAAAFGFGCFLMKRLDRYLARSGQEQTLRIGFANSSIADGIVDALEQYSQTGSGVSVCLFHGTAEELLKALFAGRLSIIFLPKDVSLPEDARCSVRTVRLHDPSAATKYGGVPVEPVQDQLIQQNVLWMEQAGEPFVDRFIECLENESVLSARQE